MTCIPNAIIPRAVDRTVTNKMLRVLFLGRIDHSSKGVLDIPKIADATNLEGLQIDIAGVGPDVEALQRSISRTGKCRYIGGISPEAVPELLSKYDVLLAPSRYEGFGITNIEAMSSGVVPIASRINGVTDVLISHGVDGFLFKVGTVREAADAIVELHRDRERLARMASAAQLTSRKYSIDVVGPKYAAVFQSVLQTARTVETLPIASYSLPQALRPGRIRSLLPESVKAFLRKVRERL